MLRPSGWIGLPVWLAAMGMCVPSLTWAAPPTPAAVPIGDVALAPGGVLVGQVVDPQGSPVQATAVTVFQENVPIANLESGLDGRFSIRGLQQGGVYQIAAGGGHGIYRVWAPGTAPPAALPQAQVVTQGPIYRGQQGPKFWLAAPWVALGIIGAAIAVPIALNASKDDPPASP
jgi:hypothetical protein